MTRTAWTITSIVVLMLVVAGGVVFRDKLMSFVPQSQQPQGEATTTPTGTVWLSFATSTWNIQYPPDFTLNAAYEYTQFGPTKPIAGVSFTIPSQMATGTNLGSDTYVSVEQLPRAKNCTADIFINDNVTAQKVTDNGVQYSVASSTGAGAGNRYEETVYALSGSSPCTAVRYFVHYGVIENYPAGAVREFDRTQLLSTFDQIRHALQLGAPATTGNTQP